MPGAFKDAQVLEMDYLQKVLENPHVQRLKQPSEDNSVGNEDSQRSSGHGQQDECDQNEDQRRIE